MKTAIATGDYPVSGETFVNRHIAHLFGGDTCIIAGRYAGRDPIGRPIFVRRTRLSLADLVASPLALARNRRRYGTGRPPFGQKARALEAFLREQGVEAVLAEFGTQALAVYPLATQMGLPVFSYFRGTDASKSLRSPHVIDAYRRMMPHLTGVFAVSRFLLDNLAAHGIAHPESHVIPSGVDVRRFTPETKAADTFLSVGRMVEKKAPLTTLRAFVEGTRERPEARLTMIGDGPLLAEARALTETLGVAHRVTLPGALPHDAVRARLARSTFFLQHSVTAADGNTEGLPTAIQEALACGCVCIATRHAGIPEAVEPERTGFLVDEGDGAGFAAEIRRALALPPERLEEMARTARDTAEARFDNAKLLTALETHMTRLARR